MPLVFLRAIAAAIVLSALAPAQEPPWPTTGWPKAEPAEAGLDAEPIDALLAAIDAGDHGNVDRVFVVRRGRAVVDRAWDRDYRAIGKGRRTGFGWGEGAEPVDGLPVEFNYLDPDRHPYRAGRRVHTLQSVTKSVTALLVGVAMRRGEIDGLDGELLPHFPDLDLAGVDPRLRKATLRDVLTMRSGIEWHESDRPLDRTNTTLQLEMSDDWIRFTLGQPMDAAPGEKWAYNSGGSHLLSGVLAHATGSFADAFARQHLFAPLGITDFHWKKDPQGFPDTEGGLYLAAEDLAKLGYLVLRDGRWDGERILPEGFVAAATARAVELGRGGRAYGYQWWRIDRGGVDIAAGLGFGGQLLLVIPDRDLVAVALCWNVFGDRVRNLESALTAALLQASGDR